MPDILIGYDSTDLLFADQHQCFIRERLADPPPKRIIYSSREIRGVGYQEKKHKQAIVFGGKRYKLPLGPRAITSFLRQDKGSELLKQWLMAKTRSVSSVILGGGREERSYADWVQRRMGEDIYETFYADFIQKKYGLEGALLSSGLARILHFSSKKRYRYLYQSQSKVSQAAYAHPEKIIVQNGKAVAVQIGGVKHLITHGLTFALPIPQILSMIEEVPLSIRVDARSIGYTDKRELYLEGDFSSAEHTTYFLDGNDPRICLEKISATEGIMWVKNGTDINQLKGLWGNANIKRDHIRTHAIPIWRTQSHFRYRRIASYLDSLGISLVGPRALFSQKDTHELLQLKEQQKEPIREFLRKHIEPPIFQEDLNVSLKRFIV